MYLRRPWVSACLLSWILLPPLQAQNLEAGVHVGAAILSEETPRGAGVSREFGVWLQWWAQDRLALSADWALLPLNDWQLLRAPSLVGEVDRNRQFVDLTLQYHFLKSERGSLFAEVGGGSFWNNRFVLNPNGFRDFEPQGKESTRKSMWSLGTGFRKALVPHLYWLGQVKIHNPGADSTTVRVFTGLTVAWK